MPKRNKTKEKQEVKPFVPSGKTEPLVFIGANSGNYMDVNCNTKRVKHGATVDTPEEFVKQRLEEGCWKRPDKVDKKDVEEEEVKTDGN